MHAYVVIMHRIVGGVWKKNGRHLNCRIGIDIKQTDRNLQNYKLDLGLGFGGYLLDCIAWEKVPCKKASLLFLYKTQEEELNFELKIEEERTWPFDLIWEAVKWPVSAAKVTRVKTSSQVPNPTNSFFRSEAKLLKFNVKENAWRIKT